MLDLARVFRTDGRHIQREQTVLNGIDPQEMHPIVAGELMKHTHSERTGEPWMVATAFDIEERARRQRAR